MITEKNFYEYGPVCISQKAYYTPLPGESYYSKNQRKELSMYEIFTKDGEDLAAFPNRKAAMKFARYYRCRQYLYQKALAMTAILSKYKIAIYVANNCEEPLVWPDCHLANDKVSFWYDEPPEAARGYFNDKEIDEDLPLDLQHQIWANNESKRQYDFAVFAGQDGDRYCINSITDIWPIDEKTFVIESTDGHTSAVQGLEDDEARQAAAIHFGVTL